ncbi:hypothetical protein M6B38_229440 [Iris pallida]|uniref:Uncharacterized protein n=1 Tax=Iris pallida TaxID=29817 RepID=A0AAX6DTN5_IRIPA|nr:hypothetical protein M6B38_229440 [Iris pallida]
MYIFLFEFPIRLGCIIHLRLLSFEFIWLYNFYSS